MSGKKRIPPDKFALLRQRARAWTEQQEEGTPETLANVEDRRLVQELHTYQIELELQNDDLRHAQTELEQSRRRYNDLYDFAPVGYLTVSEKGLINEANLTAADMLGVARGQLLKQPLSTFICHDDQDLYYHHRQKLLATGEMRPYELRMQKKDGPVFPVLMKSTINPEMDGKAGQYRVAILDISDRKELEVKLLKSKQEWEKTFDAIEDIITIQDKDRRIVRANKAAHDNFQVAPGGLNGRYCYEVLWGVEQPCQNCPFRLETLKEGKISSVDITQQHLGKIFNVTSAPIMDQNGEPAFIVHIVKDITAEKQIEEELFQIRKMKAVGTLAGGIAHHFNNILAIILGYADLIKSEIPASNPAQMKIDHIIKAGTRATELVSQILSYSRQGEEVEQAFQPAAIIKEALNFIRGTLPATIDIQAEIDPDCGGIRVNPNNFHQLIVDLCTNAFHAMGEGKGVLTVKLSRLELTAKDLIREKGISAGPFVMLQVGDTGHGMDQATAARIFEPYFTTKDVGKGTGMGLSLVHGIAKGCGGFIQVESEPGQGSVFRLYFPVVKEPALEVVAEEAEKQAPSPKGNERVLLVDDDESVASLFKDCLETLGYQVTANCSSEKTLEVFHASPTSFDLMVTDQTMPGLSGVELAEKILEIRPDLPIILCTGHSAFISEKKAKDIGIKKYLMKPVSMNDFAITVREVLDKSKASTKN